MTNRMISTEDAEVILAIYEANEAAPRGATVRERIRRRPFPGPVIHRQPQFIDVGDGVVQRLRLVVPELDRSFPADHAVFLIENGRLPSPTERLQLQAAQLEDDQRRREADRAAAEQTQRAHDAQLARQKAAEDARRAALAAELGEAAPAPTPEQEAAPEPAERPVRRHPRDAEALLADGKVVGNPELRDVAPALAPVHEGNITHRSRRAAAVAARASA